MAIFINGKEFQHIIWDFNGTILDDTKLNLSITNNILRSQDLEEVNLDTYQRAVEFPISEFYRKLGLPQDGPKFKELAIKWFGEYKNNFLKENLHPNIQNILEIIEISETDQFILSALEQGLLEEYLNHHNIAKYFKKIFGATNHNGETKFDEANNLMKEFHLNSEKTLMIGDTLHDLEVANLLNIQCLLIGHGIQHPQMLKNTKKSWYVDNCFNMSELIKNF